MELLCCNKCYHLMENSKKTFSLTQCGHVYCSECIAQASTKCLECGTDNFKSMSLSNPPTLESVINYFAPLEDFMELTLKAAQFQENQLAITMRGFEQIEKKYENMKTLYWKEVKKMKAIAFEYQKMKKEYEENEKLIQQEYEEQKPLSTKRQTSAVVNMPILSQDQSQRRHCRTITNFPVKNNTTLFDETPRAVSVVQNANITGHYSFQEQRSSSNYFTKGSQISLGKTPESNPSPAFSMNAYHSLPSSSTSGISSNTETPTPGREQVFLIPTSVKVPKSAASLRRKKRSVERLSEPK